MSRKQRIEFPGAIYYLQLNGNGNRRLFGEHRECEYFRRLLAPLCAESGGSILGYCLLPDSVHLVLKSAPDGNATGTQMGRWLIHHYTQYYNQIHNRNGSVLLQQFPCVLIEPNQYLLPVIHQLHNLPVVHALVPLPSAYPWSSHRDYLAVDPPKWLDRGEVFHRIANQRAMQVRRYEHFIEESQQPPLDWVAGNQQTVRALASDQYLQRMIASTQQHRPAPTIDLDTLTDWVCTEYGLEPQDLALWRRHRLTHEVRAVVAALATGANCADLAGVAEYFQCDPELLENGVRALNAHRQMYLFRLRSQFERWMAELDSACQSGRQRDTAAGFDNSQTDFVQTATVEYGGEERTTDEDNDGADASLADAPFSQGDGGDNAHLELRPGSPEQRLSF